MESVSLRLYSDAYPWHVEIHFPLELEKSMIQKPDIIAHFVGAITYWRFCPWAIMSENRRGDGDGKIKWSV